MKERLKTFSEIPFLLCLLLLIVNDFYLKNEFQNWFTGKLSDFCGLFVFAVFWTTIFPKRKLATHFIVAILFVIWKSPHSQVFIDLFSREFYPISRVVDFSDLLALLVLPMAYLNKPKVAINLKLNPYFISCVVILAFCATSLPRYVQEFEQPQYLLFKTNEINLDTGYGWNDFDIYDFDTLMIIGVNRLDVDQPVRSDEYYKVQLLKSLVKTVLATDNDQSKIAFDSLVFKGKTEITLPLDSFKDELNFKGCRLDGSFKRFSNAGQVIIEGQYKNGVEDSVWSFYNERAVLKLKKYFEQGELVKTEIFKNSSLEIVNTFQTRKRLIINKQFQLALITLVMFGVVSLLIANYRKAGSDFIKTSNFLKISESFVLPFGAFVLARLISLIIPNSAPMDFFTMVGGIALFYWIATPSFLVIFYLIKLRKPIDLFLYVLIFALALVLVEESVYLKNLWY